MSRNSNGRVLRTLGIVFMALTAGLTLLGGVGTSCVAFNPTGFGDRMARLAPFQWLYLLFVILGIALGVLGLRATVGLVRGRAHAYRDAVVVLIAGAAVGVIHMVVSRSLRGSSMPVDQVVYLTVLTLVLFLIFRIPSLWGKVGFNRGGGGSDLPAGGAAAILLGLTTLSLPYWMSSTHTWGRVNYAAAFHTALSLCGTACVLFGSGLLLLPVIKKSPLMRRALRRTKSAGEPAANLPD